MTAKAKVTTAAKPATPAKPAAKTATAKTAKTSTAKTTTTAKSAKTSAKTTTTKSTPAKTTATTAFAVGDLLPVCAAQAVAQSLRLAGQRVSDDELLELHYLAGGTADEPVSVGAALAAAARFGLAGYDLGSWDYLPAGEREFGVFGADGLDVASFAVEARTFPPVEREAQLHRAVSEASDRGHALILHVDRPGPHAVLATADGWWSWGELYSPWPAAIEAAWAVSWS